MLEPLKVCSPPSDTGTALIGALSPRPWKQILAEVVGRLQEYLRISGLSRVELASLLGTSVTAFKLPERESRPLRCSDAQRREHHRPRRVNSYPHEGLAFSEGLPKSAKVRSFTELLCEPPLVQPKRGLQTVVNRCHAALSPSLKVPHLDTSRMNERPSLMAQKPAKDRLAKHNARI